MVRRRNILFLLIIVLIVFLITPYYLLKNLQISEIEVRKLPTSTIEEKIYIELQNLPEIYKIKPLQSLPEFDIFLANFRNIGKLKCTNVSRLWDNANSWVSNSKSRVVDFSSSQIGEILFCMKYAKIIKADLDPRGTQLKFLFTLQVSLKISQEKLGN